MPRSSRISLKFALKLSKQIGLAAKRLFDILAALAGLIFLIPLFTWIAYLIRRDSPGPLFYRGQRMGKNGKAFAKLW